MILDIDVHHDPKVFCILHLNLLLKGLGHKLRCRALMVYGKKSNILPDCAGDLDCCHSDSSCFYATRKEVVGGILVSPCPSVCRQILCRTITSAVYW